jgi:hypothetical protein
MGRFDCIKVITWAGLTVFSLVHVPIFVDEKENELFLDTHFPPMLTSWSSIVITSVALSSVLHQFSVINI